MSLIYTLIARHDLHFGVDPEYGDHIHILVEVSDDATGNFPQIVREFILNNLPQRQKVVFNYKNKHFFHALQENGFIYICLADEHFSKERAQLFLREVQILFFSKFTSTQRELALSYSLNESFSGVLLEKMNHFVSNPVDPKNAQLDIGTPMNMKEFILENLMNTGEQVELLVKKIYSFNTSPKNRLTRSMTIEEQNRNEKLKKGIIFVTCLMVLLFLAML